MKTFITICLSVMLFATNTQAQNNKAHKIIFQLVTGDTTSHKVLMKQFGNILSVAPDTKIEVVCHGPGIDMMVKDKSIVINKIAAFKEKGVVFNVCEFSLQERKVDKAKLIEQSTFVPAGIIEIVEKQEQGWSYIKAGL
jgi:intracellular sulfur oxidation DsrE/DsrF family protein